MREVRARGDVEGGPAEGHVADAGDGARGGRAGFAAAAGLLLLLPAAEAALRHHVGEENGTRGAERERREYARVDALVRLVLTSPDVRLALSLERGLGLGGVQAFLLLGCCGSLLGRLGVANLPLPAHLLLSLGLDRGSLGLLRGFSLVRGSLLPRLLLRLLRRGGSLGVGSELIRLGAFLSLLLRELGLLGVSLGLGVLGGGEARSLGAVERSLLLRLRRGRLVHLGGDAFGLFLLFLSRLRVSLFFFPFRLFRLFQSRAIQPLLRRTHLPRHLRLLLLSL